MSDFSVTIGAVTQTASTSRMIAADLEGELQQLRRDVLDVLAAQWRGSAASAFDRAWAGSDAGARELIDWLDRLADLLGSCGRAYALDDDQAALCLRRAAS